MTKEMFVDIIVMFFPAAIMVATATMIEVSLVAAVIVAAVFSVIPKLLSDEFNENFATIYGVLVGIASYITSVVVK